MLTRRFALLGFPIVVLTAALLIGNQVDRGGVSEFERMDMVDRKRASTHALRTELDETDRRMMAIDHHLNSTNEELAREIEALREEK